MIKMVLCGRLPDCLGTICRQDVTEGVGAKGAEEDCGGPGHPGG